MREQKSRERRCENGKEKRDRGGRKGEREKGRNKRGKMERGKGKKARCSTPTRQRFRKHNQRKEKRDRKREKWLGLKLGFGRCCHLCFAAGAVAAVTDRQQPGQGAVRTAPAGTGK